MRGFPKLARRSIESSRKLRKLCKLLRSFMLKCDSNVCGAIENPGAGTISCSVGERLTRRKSTAESDTRSNNIGVPALNNSLKTLSRRFMCNISCHVYSLDTLAHRNIVTLDTRM